jgi:thiol-disulfide isomerase/thioredoxin
MRTAAWLLLGAALALQSACGGSELAQPPEFTHQRPADWLNSAPLTLAALRGKVVLVEFWAFDCVNCRASLPWVESLAASRAGSGLVVVAVHTPELPQERSAGNVREAVTRLDIRYPVMLDGDSSYWNAMHNQYWPAFYLIGRDGLIHAHVIGEMHTGDDRARRLESLIDQQLAATAS